MKRIGWVPVYFDDNKIGWPWVEMAERRKYIVKEYLRIDNQKIPRYLRATYKNIKILPVYVDGNKLRIK